LPGDGDILVPVGTIAVIGTTSITVDDPNDTSILAWEVQKMLDEGEKMVPGFSQARPLRAWAGVRPLYEEGAQAQGREAKRTFAVLDHATRDGVNGLVTVVGGKFTTYRLMAEKAADAVCAQLGVDKPCVTREFSIADFRFQTFGARHSVANVPPAEYHFMHTLPHRLEEIEGASQGQLICECELVTRDQLEQAVRDHPAASAEWVLDDLRRDLRLGMGPCQGGFCGYRAAGILHAIGCADAAQTGRVLANFAEKRWKGQRPLLWGQGLRQALLDEHIYRGILGLDGLE
jgi:glycerol-3-phosphate dehydrogenase